MSEIYGTYQQEPTELELKNRKLAYEVAQEGFVLLKNDNQALPIQGQNVALYGMGARKTVKGGLGSGSVEERYSVNIEDGLKNAGLTVTTQSWLDDYDDEYARTYQEYVDMVEDKIKGMTNPMEIIPYAHSFVYRFPSGRGITEEDIKNSNTDTAIYVLMRQAGEGNDRKLEQGDYYITDVERENLKVVAEAYKKTVLVINIGGTLDLGFLDEIPGIDAVIQFVQGGEEGGNALADLLVGKANFSGKLADTIPMKYEDIPFSDEFSYLNGDLGNEYYKEGIYVGYRYFDTFGVPVRYPFGFGLSYSDFDIKTEKVSVDGVNVELHAKVTNTGSIAGKETVQVYISAPAGKLNKEYQSLVAYEKTELLGAGETGMVTVSFDLKSVASYDEERASYILEKGDYIVRLGNSSRDTEVVAVLTLDETAVTVQCENKCVATDDVLKKEMIAAPLSDEKKMELFGEGALVKSAAYTAKVSASSIQTKEITYQLPEVVETEQEEKILDMLTVEELAEFTLGGALQNPPAGALDIAGAAGKTTTSLIEKGIRNVVFSDGPAGINVTNELCQVADGSLRISNIPERYNWGVLRQFAARMCTRDGKMVYRYATAWPVEMLVAQTWNAPLVEKMGEAVAEEMTLFGITVWLSPGMNIHRNPLGGRTFEYYSEDPVISGTMAAAITNGVQSKPGVYTCIKHFCCNNTEDNRNGISSNVSERALREIYLKGFEIAVRTSQPATLMSSYNQLNHVYTGNNGELLNDILRNEWGFEGLVMTDWNACNERAARPEECVINGNDLIMPSAAFDRENVKFAIETGKISEKAIRTSATRVLHMMLSANTKVLM